MTNDVLFHVRRPQTKWRLMVVSLLLVVAVAALMPAAGATDPTGVISSVSPSSGSTLGGTAVTITGTGFTGATSVEFGSTGAASFQVVSDTQIKVVTAAESAGIVDITIVTPGGNIVLSDAYTFVVVPTISGVSPAYGNTSGGLPVTITGTGFTGATSVNFGTTAIPAAQFVSSSDTQVVVKSPAHGTGSVMVAVTTPGGTAQSTGITFTYVGAPTFTSISPAMGDVSGGNTVILIGSGFNVSATDDTPLVYFNNTAVYGTVLNSTGIQVTVPAAATGTAERTRGGYVPVNVTTYLGHDKLGTATLSDAYLYLGQPTITSVSPSSGYNNGPVTVTIKGTYFWPGVNVTLGDSPTSATVVATNVVVTNATYMTATLDLTNVSPTALHGTWYVFATNIDTRYGYRQFTVYPGAPVIDSIIPSSGLIQGGNFVIISGSDLNYLNSVRFGSQSASINSFNNTMINVTVPLVSAAQSVDVTVTTGTGTGQNRNSTTVTSGYTYTYASVPTISSITPTSGNIAGNFVYITGTGFTGVDNTGSVTFDTTYYGSINECNDTFINVTAPSHAVGTVPVVVVAYGGSATTSYTYVNTPVWTSISPTNGTVLGGTTVTITGQYFQGASAVTFNLTPATISSISSDGTTITAVTPVANGSVAGAVNVQVTTPGGVTSIAHYGSHSGYNAFSYTEAPIITSISPNNGTIVGGTEVHITGTGLSSATSVTFGGLPGTGLSYHNMGHYLEITTPAHAAGAVDVVVVTPTGSVVNTSGYTYLGAPTIASISPSSGKLAGGETVTISGMSFTGVNKVTFNGTIAVFTVVNDTTITATTPAQATAATVPVVVSSSLGSATGSFTYGNEIPAVPSAIGVFRASTDGYWYLSNGDGTLDKTVTFGQSGDIPVVGDWNGAGQTEIGVFRPSTGNWYLDTNNDGVAEITVHFGKSGDTPVVGDWNNAGHSEIGVFRPSTGNWYLNTNFESDSVYKAFHFGANGDTPVVGDWNNAGYSEIGVFRPSTGNWYADYNFDGTVDASTHFGKSGDSPVVGDWNNAGHSEIGVFRPSNGNWYVNYNFNGVVDASTHFGKSGDSPVVGDWNNAGHSEIGVFRPSSGNWYVDYSFDGTVDAMSLFGQSGDTPFVPATDSWA